MSRHSPDLRYRVGGHWRVTVVQYHRLEEPDRDGRRPSDRLICMAASELDAVRIVAAMNGGDDDDVEP